VALRLGWLDKGGLQVHGISCLEEYASLNKQITHIWTWVSVKFVDVPDNPISRSDELCRRCRGPYKASRG
jgi:hypothetical protein